MDIKVDIGMFPDLAGKSLAKLQKIKRETGLTGGRDPVADKHYGDALQIASGTMVGNVDAAGKVITAAIRMRPLELAEAARELYHAKG